VTKKEIVKQLCDKANKEKLLKGSLTQLATKEIVQWTFDAIIETLVAEGRIELRNFGVFEVKQRKPRKARNPRTGTRVDVAAKNVVTFQPGKEMEERVRQYARPIAPKRKPRRGSKADDSDDTNETPVSAKPSRNGADAPKPEPAVAGATGE
jgi:nucleoid DNA-binding protein